MVTDADDEGPIVVISLRVPAEVLLAFDQARIQRELHRPAAFVEAANQWIAAQAMRRRTDPPLPDHVTINRTRLPIDDVARRVGPDMNAADAVWTAYLDHIAQRTIRNSTVAGERAAAGDLSGTRREIVVRSDRGTTELTKRIFVNYPAQAVADAANLVVEYRRRQHATT